MSAIVCLHDRNLGSLCEPGLCLTEIAIHSKAKTPSTILRKGRFDNTFLLLPFLWLYSADACLNSFSFLLKETQ